MRANKDSASFMAYKKVQQEVQKATRRAKRKVERKLAKDGKTNAKSFFSYIKKKTSNRVSVGPLKVDDEVIADSSKMASILNTWYCSMFTEEDLTNLPQAEDLCREGEALETVEFTAERGWCLRNGSWPMLPPSTRKAQRGCQVTTDL